MLLHNKGNHKQCEKTTLWMGENNSKGNNWQRINFQNTQEAHTTQCQKNKQPNQKVGERPKQKTYRWLTNTWKDAQHHSLLEKCKSKLQWDITSHWSEWPSAKSTNNKCWRGYGEKGLFLHYMWEYKLIQPLWKMVWRFL